ncbi:MAG: hypothetical protein QXD25_01655 [Nanopusillaceae archaeon]
MTPQNNKNIIGIATIRKTKDDKEIIVIKIDKEINFDKNKDYRIVISKEKLEKNGSANAYLHEYEKPEKLQKPIITNQEKEKLDDLLSKIQDIFNKIENLEERIRKLEKYAFD